MNNSENKIDQVIQQILDTDKHSKQMFKATKVIYYIAIAIMLLKIIIYGLIGWTDSLVSDAVTLVSMVGILWAINRMRHWYTKVDYSAPVFIVLKSALERYNLKSWKAFFPAPYKLECSILYILCIVILISVSKSLTHGFLVNYSFLIVSIYVCLTILSILGIYIYLWNTKYKSLCKNLTELLKDLES